MLNKIIRYFLENRFVTVLLLLVFIGWGLSTAPFDWKTGFIPKDAVPVDAIPDIGENQQIVFTNWEGKSPQDIEDQITYPLTTSLLGISGVKTIRSTSMFGFSSIYIIFDEDVEFYWSRSRILEKLNSLPAGLLPKDAIPALGPDATALGQVFWYTIEGRDSNGNVTGGWDLHELRKVQDFYVKYGLNAANGVSEVASIGGQVQEYQVDVNPDALKANNIGFDMVMMAVKNSNKDIGANTIEINKAEYMVRGLGYIKSIKDIEEAVVAVKNNTPILVKDLANVSLGAAPRRGVLDKEGAEVVGGVVIARYGSNPLEVINNIKDKIKEIATGLPKKTLANGTVSQLTIVPFYDRTALIQETIGTLESALSEEIIISIIVVIILLFNLRASFIIASLLPLAVLITFIIMRYTGVDANVVALSGIAIAIGVMVDVGIVFIENCIRYFEMPENKDKKGKQLVSVIYNATVEIAPAITVAIATTIVSFLPVFFMENAEGKLFKPLAFTKTFALAASFIIGIIFLPTLAYLVFGIKFPKQKLSKIWNGLLILSGVVLAIIYATVIPIILTFIGVKNLLENKYPVLLKKYSNKITIGIALLFTTYILTKSWTPLGHQNSLFSNYLMVAFIIVFVLTFIVAVIFFYEHILVWCLNNKRKFLLIPSITILFGLFIWIGFNGVFGWTAKGFESIGFNIRTNKVYSYFDHKFPGIGKEFMPSLNEGSFLLMPTSMPHAGIEETTKTVKMLDMSVANIPEVEVVVGKLGRAETALDPAPISMYENVINYKSEFILNEKGQKETFKTDKKGHFILKNGDTLSNEALVLNKIETTLLIQDDDGKIFRNWRKEIKSPNDIWNEIVKATSFPGITSAPKLQPIETRLVMLQTGMRAPMGIKVYGQDLNTIQQFGIELENVLKTVPSIKTEAVFADRIVGKPYLNINIDRTKIARYGLSIEQTQQAIETAIGGMPISTTVEGRERYNVRVRYPRELRDDPEKLKNILIPTPTMAQVPLGELVEIEYEQGPQMIKSEDTFLVGYVLFDKKEGYAEVDVVEDAQQIIDAKIASGELVIPPQVNFKFSGNFENQVRAVKRLSIVIPICLGIIFLLLFFQFKTVIASTIHFSGVFVAFAGGFIMIWLWGQDWFMNFSISGINMRDLFQMHTINLSVAVWVGFIALFGIATDDGVLMGTYIHQVFEERNPKTVAEVRQAVIDAGKKRVRPAMMTTAVTIIALIPVLTSTGKGSDIMVPMAIPTFGGMIIQIMTIFVVPILQATWRENAIKKTTNENK